MKRRTKGSSRRTKASTPAPGVWSLASGLTAAFLLKLAVMWQLKDHVLTQPDAGLDTTTYVALAQRVLGGDVWLGPGLYFVSPLYIHFLAGVLAVTESFTAVRLLQIALGTTAVACVYVSTNEWFGRRAAWLAASLAVFTGLFTFYESLLLQAALDPFLTAAATASLALGLRRNNDRWFIAAGLTFGVQTLNRPNIVIAACGITMLLALARRWRTAALFAVAVLLALAPAALRNFVVAGTWSPVSSHGGLNFYIGNNAEADGTYHSVAGITPNLEGQQDDARRVAERAVGRTLDDVEVSGYFYGLGWRWIREQPLAAAKLFIRKLSMVLSSANIWLNYSYVFFKYDAQTLLRALFVGPWILIPLGLVGLIVAAPKPMRLEYLIWASFVPMYAMAVAMFFVADRYTLPLLVPLCATGGAALDAFARAFSSRRWAPLAIGAAAFVVLLAVVNRPLEVDDGVAEERVRMAERLITLNRYDEADQWAERAESVHPRRGLVHFRLGQRLLTRKQSEAAIRHFEKAQRLDPGQPEVEFALGDTLLDARRPDEAVVHLRRAFDAGFQTDRSGELLVRALGATGDSEGAISVLRNIQPARQEDGERWVSLGDLAMQLRAPELAERFFDKAVAAQPGLASAHFGLAAASATFGRVADAQRHLQDTLRLDPGFEPARRLQEMLR